MAARGASQASPSFSSPSRESRSGPLPPPSPSSAAVSKSPLDSQASSSSSPPRAGSAQDESLPLAVFYGPLDAKNPLLASCEKEIRELLGFVKRKKTLATTEEQKYEFQRRCATRLFNIWTKYAPRLPADYYNENLLKVGNSLYEAKEYKLALLQCYGRYLQQFSADFDENKADVNQFKTVFFPKGFGDKTAAQTFQALSGKNICSYQLVCDNDVNLQNQESVAHCLRILSSLRLLMQVALPHEHLCWIVFNGTIYIYTICRKLMVIGQSAKALEYLLWASICMESSVPLLSVRYLTWRATLYTAVCQCYYDSQAAIHGETFARRGLAKIDELRQLELMSSSQSQQESRNCYREATIKMAVMIFKRGVFESRRKNKAYLRPKLRINIKETQALSWPSTITERLLDEMFDSTASRFLAVLEALSDPNRRTLQTVPVAIDEIEIREIVTELFIAGRTLLLVSNMDKEGILDFPVTSFLKLLIGGKNVISLDAALKFTKLAFNYEEWSLFESSAGQILEFIQGRDEPESKKAEKDLILLVVVEPLINIKKSKGTILPLENYKEGLSAQDFVKKSVLHNTCVKTCTYSEDIFHLAAVLYSCVCNSPQNIQPDKEIVVDMIMFLWQKCKFGIQRLNIPKNDYAKFTQKISSNKWIYLLWQINEVIQCYRMEDIDIVMVAEVTLRISEILEFLGNPQRRFKKSLEKRIEEFLGTPKGSPEILPILKKKPIEQLFLAYTLLDKAINGINLHCMLTNLSDGSSAIDHCYTKYPHADGDIHKPVTTNTFIMDLHVELIRAQHRIATLLLDKLNVLQIPEVSEKIPTRAPEKPKQSKNPDCFTELTVMNKIRKNKISKAIFLIQKALLIFEKDTTCIFSQEFLMEAYSLIEKAEMEQNALYLCQKCLESSERKESKVPPPPLLLSRTHCSVTLKPAPFTTNVKVSWYSILGCKAEGSFGKVRLNNNHLPNSGEMIPADGKTVFEVKGLETNEKYIFAVAAYSSSGKLIGDSIGESTKPILIYPPLSTVTTRMFLTQAAYQIGEYELAKKIFSPVWDYFVASPPHDEKSIISLNNIMTITQRRLYSDILADTPSTLLYLFLRNIFVISDIKVKEENLFCDNIKGNEISPSQNIARLVECEKVLVALELSNYLNDSGFALQAVIQCYGLLAPIIFHNIVLVPVVQILIKCLVVLQALPNVLQSKKNVASFESIQHMVACSIYYLIKILRSWREYDLAVIIINYGKRMLDITPGCKLFGYSDREEVLEEVISKKILVGKPKKPLQLLVPEKINEQLVMLETHLLKLVKQVATCELSGAEDPIFLYPIVLNWPVKGAAKEVLKFKHRPRFLEFFTQIMLKCLNDEKFHLVLEITNPVTDFLRRRNESLTGMRRYRYKENILGKKGQKSVKYKAVIMEIGRTDTVIRKRTKKRETLRDFFARNPNIFELMEQERNRRNDVRKAAQKFLISSLSPLILRYIKRKRFHQICTEELPWRAQMNLYLAIAYYNLFLTKLAERIKGKCYLHTFFSFQVCDPDMFSLSNSGTLLPTCKLSSKYYEVMIDFLLTSKKQKANLPNDAEEFSAFINAKLNEENVTKPQNTHKIDSQMGLNYKEKERGNMTMLDNFTKIFLFCRRAMVLAHRGGYWTLLQNCCRTFWNITQELQLFLKQTTNMSKIFPVSQDGFLCTIILPFYFGAELLIDMLLELQNVNAIKVMEEKEEFSVPSCYGNIRTDNGGSSLSFEQPLDDVNMADLKWIRDYVLKSLELLYQVEKWETLVSLAMQFNALSHERYTEQVTPLLVYAQHQLLLRIDRCKDPDITQQACVRYEAEHGEKITYKNFIGTQLKIRPSIKKDLSPAIIKEITQDFIYSEYDLAKKLVCVPVDVTDTLRYFRETLKKSKYHNRCIRHSRKLLSLFLAQLQDKERASSPKVNAGKVEFCLGTEDMHLPTPPDLSQEHFRVLSSVEKSKLPLSQVGLVISSYHKTIDVLETSNQRSLKVQALHELGNLLIFAEKKRAALKCWSQALDDIFRKPNVLHTWKEFGPSPTSATNSYTPPQFKDYSEEFLSKVDIWGCLQGAVISAKIAQFIETVDVSKRTNCCILSALLFQGLLRTTHPHPKADRCYAQYEVTQLLPGVELFSDRYRADICTVIASLYYVIRELHFANHNLIILPLLALYQYFVSVICQDLVRNLEARILKIEVLIDLRFFSEAFSEMMYIFYGKNMPSSIPAGYKPFGRVKIFQSFDTGKSLYNKENIQALDEIISKGMPPILTMIGQQHLLNKYSFVKAYFLINLAATINCIPEYITKFPLNPEKCKVNTLSLRELILREEGSSVLQLTKPRDDVILCIIKSVLLTEAEDKLNSLLVEVDHSAHKSLAQYSAGELEIVVEAQLQLAAVALQRHRTAYSSAIVFSILKLLQDSKLFKQKVSSEGRESFISTPTSVCMSSKDEEFLDSISLHSREYFNIHLWLRCCLALVTAFVAQVRGIGIITENDLTDVGSLINDVFMEAKNADDKELQAEFLMQAVIIGLQEKHLKTEIITKLQDIIQLLEGNAFISPRSYLTLVRSMLLMDDLTKAEKFQDASSKTDKLHLLAQCHSILIEQMLVFGETIEFPVSNTDYASPIQPLKNIYLPHIMLLAKTKMRIGHTLAKQVCQSSKKKDSSRWLPSLHLLQIALKLCKTTVTEEHEVEAEILFQKGKIERQMFMEDKSLPSNFESLFEAIQLSLKNDQNSGLIRDSYLEMAILFLHLLKLRNKLSVSPSAFVAPVRRYSSLKDQLGNRLEMYSSLAWIAIRAASQVSKAVLAVNQHFGKNNSRIDKVSQDTIPTIPEFASMDLFSSYTDYLLGNHQVVSQTGCNQSVFYQSDDWSDNTDTTKKAETKVDVTWILLLRYYIHLQRTNNMSKLLASLKSETGNYVQVDSLFTSLFNSALILRQKEMHCFLKKFLQLYSSSCIDEFPRELLQDWENLLSSDRNLFESSGKAYRNTRCFSLVVYEPFVPAVDKTVISTDMATQALNKELCFQWYIPPLEKPPRDTEPMVLLLYAYNLKPMKISDVKCSTYNNASVGSLWVPLNRVISIHEKLSNLTQIAEISLPTSSEIISDEEEPEEEMDRLVDKDIELMVLECCSNILSLFLNEKDASPLSKVPFVISLKSILDLERLFDLANGGVISKGSLFQWILSLVP
ncbi:cilia- and flagella-associated protein 54 [Sorex araneus]|uniref:cilia- and flagella-associated protein 54 n=1 Tax=Sorex araneus TaxID=42254 RepID=UPI002433624E|nr:cilia- and flagella-associated protein 54 [Sorex araneus]